jgi:antitoxin CcdA
MPTLYRLDARVEQFFCAGLQDPRIERQIRAGRPRRVAQRLVCAYIMRIRRTLISGPNRLMSASKKAVNVSIDADLLREARDRNINLSATLERALTASLNQSRRDRWLAENKRGIAAYNDDVDEHGAFADRLRRF